MKGIEVMLPVLTMFNSLTLCENLGLLLPEDKNEYNAFFVHLLWLAGGVPRYIAKLVYSIAVKVLKSDAIDELCDVSGYTSR